MCWYPPERWQNKPGQFRIQPDDNGPGEWFEVSEGHIHVDKISTLQYKEGCMHFKRKAASGINTKVSRYIVRGRPSACIDPEIEG